MSLDEKLEVSATEGLDKKVDSGFFEIFGKMSLARKLLLGGWTAFSLYFAGASMTAGMIAVNLLVYRFLQKKNKESMTEKGVFAEWLYGALSAPYFVLGYHYFNKLGNIFQKIIAGFGVLIPLSLSLYFPIKNALHNYTFREFCSKLWDGSLFEESYESIRLNVPTAYKKILFYFGVPLVAFWHFAELGTQAFYHGVLGGLSRLATKAIVDKDIKEVHKKEDRDYMPDMATVPSPA